jgi:putative transposase
MTAPRQVLPGTIYLITRRCSERRFFLRPSRVVSAVFLYVLGVAARLHGVRVHAFCVLSNHYHLLVTDPQARLPAFMQYLDSLVARAMNAALGRWEGFWSSDGSYSAVAHDAKEDVVRKAAYILANPVAAGLVRRGREWPGLWTAPEQLGVTTFTAPRPEVFFRADGGMPSSVELTLAVPEGFESAEEFQALVGAALHELEERARRERSAAGRGFLGRARVLAQSPFARPPAGEPRRKLNPRVAARDRWRRVEALSRMMDFLHAYRAAWAAMRRGVRDVVFPAGTYRLRLEYGVACAAPASG